MRRAPAAGGLLRREQPDGALDAGARTVGRARVRGQGGRLRHSRDHHRRHRPRRDCRRVHLGRRARARRAGPDADRARVHAHVRPRAPRRHALPRARIRHSSWDYPPLAAQGGYADRDLLRFWAARDPIAALRGAARGRGRHRPGRPRRHQARSARRLVEEQARAVIDAPWPEPRPPGPACSRTSRRESDVELLEPVGTAAQSTLDPPPAALRTRRLPFDPKGRTFLEAVMLGVGDALRADPRVFVYGEDVGGQLRQRVPAAAPAAQGVRRPHHQLAARRRRRARRLRRRGARRAAADRRDPVQRLRRHRLQPAREQRGEDPLPLGRLGADGRAHALGRPASRRARTTARTPSPGSIGRPG